MDIINKLLAWATEPPTTSEPLSVLKIFALIAVILYVVMLALKALIESVSKALEAYKNSGLAVIFGRERRDEIRRRQQFCMTLYGDLLNLAKAENWNDQFFTDLEAEVEAEGRYYASAFHRLIGRQSFGLRRVSSLISAIETSSEQALLVVGQPGSGKSVALRHLAHQFAERGMRSGAVKGLIPLYLNLRELGPAPYRGANADFIKEFVMDNIRRGDSDTAQYVKEHWEKYRLDGNWFFLFDSFDEIPAVLHAPTESPIIKEYAEAIRQFLHGMSSCRGVLASREFKGPNTLPWQKVRILPLGEERQNTLIDNSFLEPPAKALVKQHVVSSSSTLYDNPLFLTLLCRYVKDTRKLPLNDHDLLSNHINKLAERDAEYVKRKYDLTADQLLHGAIQLALLFAERVQLSLAPSMSEIEGALGEDRIADSRLDNMLSALVYVKICRSDVREARPGDRRFAFSHRRYQETLFVRYIADHEDYIGTQELLTNSRWREYAVTLLQSQSLEVIEPLLDCATALIHRYSPDLQDTMAVCEFDASLRYWDWRNDPSSYLILLLQEGMARRVSDVKIQLRRAIEDLLVPRWTEGDIYDQMMVLRHGGLLPQPVLASCIKEAIEHGGVALEGVQFARIRFLEDIPEEIATWVRNRISKEAILAIRPAERLRLEAVCGRLPPSIGARFILNRCEFIKKISIYEFFIKIARRLFPAWEAIYQPVIESIIFVIILSPFVLIFEPFIVKLVPSINNYVLQQVFGLNAQHIGFVEISDNLEEMSRQNFHANLASISIAAFVSLWILLSFFLSSLRSVGRRITLNYLIDIVLARLSNITPKSILMSSLYVLVAVAVAFAVFGVPMLAIYIVSRFVLGVELGLGQCFVYSMFIWFVIAIGIITYAFFDERKTKSRYLTKWKDQLEMGFRFLNLDFLQKIESDDEMEYVLMSWLRFSPSYVKIRSMLRLLPLRLDQSLKSGKRSGCGQLRFTSGLKETCLNMILAMPGVSQLSENGNDKEVEPDE